MSDTTTPLPNPAAFARKGGLRYVSDAKPGITRRRQGKNFLYFDPSGKRIHDEAELARVKAIGVPPAYEQVWICPHANGHLQATGIDARGRKQYRYHVHWREIRDETKFQHILRFGEALPAIRARVKKDAALHGLPREKVLATVVGLLEKTLIRVGNSEYARTNESYGLTTIKDEHVEVKGSTIRFSFTGKSGKAWNLSVADKRIAAVIKRCADIPGHELFKYVADDGSVHDVESADVNAYLREITGEDFTAKDFRTWSGTVLAAIALQEFEAYDSQAQAKKNVVRAIEHVSERLGNTPAVCRKCYVHPEILSSYLDTSLSEMVSQKIDEALRDAGHLSDDELMVLAFLRRRLSGKTSVKKEARH